MIKLKDIEDLFEKYYNSGDFKMSIDFLFEKLFGGVYLYDTYTDMMVEITEDF